MQPSTNGNYGWADISISETEFVLGVGEHFYEPSAGGDTESRHVFEAYAGGDFAEGNIDEWLAVASVIAASGSIDVEDYSDHVGIDWTAEPANEE